MGGWLAADRNDSAPLLITPGGGLSSIALEASATSARLPSAGNQFIDPQASFPVEVWSAVLFASNIDPAYKSALRLWVDGSPSALQTTASTVAFSDPFSGVTYRALSFSGTAQTFGGLVLGSSSYVHPATGVVSSEAGVAARMLLHLADLETVRQKHIAANQSTTQIVALEQSYLELVSVLVNLNALAAN